MLATGGHTTRRFLGRKVRGVSRRPKAPLFEPSSDLLRPSLDQLEATGPLDGPVLRAAERVTVRRPAYLPGVEIWAVLDSARLWTMLYECHSFSGQDVANASWTETRNTLRYRRGTITLGGHHLLLGTPGEVSRQLEACDAPFHAINVFPEAVSLYLPEPRGFELPALDDERVYGLFSNAWRAVEADDLDVTERESHMHAFLSCAFALTTDAQAPVSVSGCERSIKRAREFMHDRYAESIALSDIARAAERSVWYLERSFAASVGVPIHVYLRHVRLARAMELLRRGQKASHVSSAAGFSDQAHMTRTFRRCLGVTPKLYQHAGSA
jgi:AraC-like DNA-binding protein